MDSSEERVPEKRNGWTKRRQAHIVIVKKGGEEKPGNPNLENTRVPCPNEGQRKRNPEPKGGKGNLGTGSHQDRTIEVKGGGSEVGHLMMVPEGRRGGPGN